jgi:hypothetical protein
LYHSYDDKPSMVYMNNTFRYTFQWHKNGVLFRSENLPFSIEIYKEVAQGIIKVSYATFDSNENVHSYNDMPAAMSSVGPWQTLKDGNLDYNFLIQWANYGKLIRANDKPTIIRVWKNFPRESYHNGNGYHRDNNPAIIEENKKLWIVADALHNQEGPAKVERREINTPYFFNWFLYGVHLKEPTFNKIKTYQKTKNVPFWVAFLWGVELTNDEAITHFMNNFDNWDSNLPINWILHTLNVTKEKWDTFAEEIFKSDAESSYRQDNRLEFEPARLHRFLAIIEHEKQLLEVKEAQNA